MKKILIYVLFMMPLMVHAQVFSKDVFQYANKSWAIGFAGGALGVFDEKTTGVFGLNLTIKGFYIDFLGNGSSHVSDVKVDKWKENSGYLFHFGYQIPITKSFRIIPVVGYYTQGTTTTDGYDWKVTSSGIRNKTYTDIDSRGFDSGGIIVLNVKHVNFYGVCTMHSIYGAIAYQF